MCQENYEGGPILPDVFCGREQDKLVYLWPHSHRFIMHKHYYSYVPAMPKHIADVYKGESANVIIMKTITERVQAGGCPAP